MISIPTFIITHAPQLKTHTVYSIFGIKRLIDAGYDDEEIEALNMTKMARRYFNKYREQKRIDWMFKMTGAKSRDELLELRSTGFPLNRLSKHHNGDLGKEI